MSAVFLKILNMSITASWLILAVILARLLLKKAPKWIRCLLWGLVAVRLVCPVSFESVLSLIPSSETIPANIALQKEPTIHSGITVVNEAVNPVLAESFTPVPTNSVNPLQIVIAIAAIVWIVGIVVMLAYALISYGKLRKTVSVCVPVGERIVACDEVKAPFILGICRPTVYVPSGMNGTTLAHVVRHEKAHLQRHDHWWKPLGFLLLAIYWFHPLCWIAYILLCRDIEMACDEKVIRTMNKEEMAAYSQALLDCSFPRKRIAACPLAFGEVGVKERVKGVLHYKKPAFWIILIAVIACVTLAVCLMTNPRSGFPIDRAEVERVTYYNRFVGDDCQGELNAAQIDEMVERFSAITKEKRDNRYEGQTPGYQLCVFLRDGSFLYANGYHSIDDMVEVIAHDKRYAVSDAGFAAYLRNVCSRGETAFAVLPAAPFGHDYTVHEIRYEDKRSGGNSAIPLPVYGLSNKQELLILEDLNSDKWLNAGTLTEIELSKDTFDRYFPSDGKTVAADLRRHNAKTWQLVVSDLPDSLFYDLLLQKDGEVFLSRGYYDATEKDDPDSDDTRITHVFFLKEYKTVTGIALREKYPAYFDLDTSSGLEVYVWQMAQDSYSCGVMPGTNRDKTLKELMNLKGASIAEMREILSAYDIDEKDITVIPWQNPISSYIAAYWIGQEEEDPTAAEERKQAYIDMLQRMLLDDVQIGDSVYDLSASGAYDCVFLQTYAGGAGQPRFLTNSTRIQVKNNADVDVVCCLYDAEYAEPIATATIEAQGKATFSNLTRSRQYRIGIEPVGVEIRITVTA